MSQDDFGTLDPDVVTGTSLATLLEAFRTAIHSSHMGSGRPSYAVAGMLWLDDTDNPEWALKLYDGADDIEILRVDTSGDALELRIPSGTSAPTSTAAGQLWLDTSGSPDLLKLRDQANSAWVVLGSLDGTTWTPYTAGAAIQATSVSVGEIRLYAGGTAPANWALCQGQELARATYPDLDALLDAEGYPYGNGDGSTTFNLPDARGRVPVGAGAGAGLTSRALGDEGGAETHTLTEAQMPAHTHSMPLATIGTSPATWQVGSQDEDSNTQYPEESASAGSGDAFSLMPPFTVLNYIIRVLP